MIPLIKNEWHKLFSGKIFLAFLGVVLFLYVLPIVETILGLNHRVSLSGQTLSFSVLGPLATNILPLFIIISMSQMLVEEYVNGTLTLTLIQPVSRAKILTAKLLSLILPLFIFLFFSLLSGYLIGTLFFGWGEQFLIQGRAFSPAAGIGITLGSYLLTLIPLLAFVSFVMLLSLQFNSSGVAVGILLGILVGMSVAGQLFPTLQPYLLVFQISYFGTLFLNPQWDLIGRALLVVLAYGMGSYLLSIYLFKKRDISY